MQRLLARYKARRILCFVHRKLSFSQHFCALPSHDFLVPKRLSAIISNSMRSVKFVYLLLVLALSLVLASSTNAINDGEPYLRRSNRRYSREPSLVASGIRALCIPTVSQVLEDHEGRHECAYNHSNGFRAVGVGYNLDDDVETRRSELSLLLTDYDKVYKGESCLYNIQITALLTLDAKRALDKAAETVAPLDDFCCEVQAVFADVQHSIGVSRSFPDRDMDTFIQKATLKEWTSAAHELKETDWCHGNQKRCDDNIITMKSGCNTLF